MCNKPVNDNNTIPLRGMRIVVYSYVTMTPPTHPTRLHHLGPTTARNTTPEKLALAALVRGIDTGTHPARIRSWLISRHPKTAPLVTGPAWPRLVTAARARVATSTGAAVPGSPTRRQLILTLTQRWLTTLLTPTPTVDRAGEPLNLRARSINTARGVVAVSAVGMLRQVAWPRQGHKPMDSMLLSDPNTAVRLGVTRVAARRGRQIAEQLGWWNAVSLRPGAPSRYRLARVHGPARDLVVRLDDTIEAVTDWLAGEGDTTPEGLDAQMILAADHPVWAYSPRPPGSRRPTQPDRTTWLVGVCDAVTIETGTVIDPGDTMGLSVGLVRAHRRILDDTGLLAPGVEVADRLTEIGHTNGAMDRARTTNQARRAEAAAQAEAMDQARARKRTAVHLVRQALVVVGGAVGVRVVGPEDSRKGPWAAALHEALAGQVPPDHVREVRAEVVRVLVRAGHEREPATRIAARIVPDPVGLAA